MTAGDAIQLIGAVIALTALVYAARSLELARRTARAQFWLTLRDQFARHDEVHRRLRPGGEWTGGHGPETAEEWAQVEAYMGLFEHCEAMLAEGILDERTFARIYRYRVQNLLANPVIVREKLVLRREGWRSFLELVQRLGLPIPGPDHGRQP